jgi:hypothetical protein
VRASVPDSCRVKVTESLAWLESEPPTWERSLARV